MVSQLKYTDLLIDVYIRYYLIVHVIIVMLFKYTLIGFCVVSVIRNHNY